MQAAITLHCVGAKGAPPLCSVPGTAFTAEKPIESCLNQQASQRRAELPTADLMLHMELRLGHRLGLDSIAHATLGVQKTAAGLDAIRWWREGRVLEIAEYCCFDVKVTKLVHEHGCRHKELFFHDRFAQKQRVEIDWCHLD